MAEAALDPTEQFQKMTRDVIDPIQALPLKERAPKYQSAMAELLPQQILADVAFESAKSARDISVKEGGAEESQRQTLLQEKEMQEGIAKRDKYALPTFTPTQEDLGTYAQLASSIMTMGLMIGASGKSSAKIAVASMTGMLKGWKEGRKDLYERESKNFEKESARISNIRKDIQSDLDRAMRLWPTKRKDAIALIETARYKAGTESVLGAMLYKGNYDGVMKWMESARKVDEAKLKHEQDMAAKAETASLLAKYRADTMAQRERLALARGKTGKTEDKDDRAKATTIDVREYRALQTQERIWGRMKEKLSDDKFQKKFDSLGLKKLFFEPIAGDGVIAKVSETMSAKIAEATQKNDPEILGFLQDIIQVRNAYYLVQSGKAVTGGEAARNFFVTAQPTDAAPVLFGKVDRAIKEVAEEMRAMENSYKNIKPAKKPGDIPVQSKSNPDVTKEEYKKLKPGDKYWWDGKEVTKGQG